MSKTTIQLDKSTRDRLAVEVKYRLDCGSYDEAINTLLDESEPEMIQS